MSLIVKRSQVLRHAYHISLLLLGFWELRPFLFNCLHIEFATPDIKANYVMIWNVLIPFCLLIVFAKLTPIPENNIEIVVKILGVLVILVFAFLISFISIFSSMCNWSKDKTLFIHTEKNIEIGVYSYACGAYDSDDQNPTELRYEKPLNTWFKINKPIDTAQIDRSKWISVSAKNELYD